MAYFGPSELRRGWGYIRGCFQFWFLLLASGVAGYSCWGNDIFAGITTLSDDITLRTVVKIIQIIRESKKICGEPGAYWEEGAQKVKNLRNGPPAADFFFGFETCFSPKRPTLSGES